MVRVPQKSHYPYNLVSNKVLDGSESPARRCIVGVHDRLGAIRRRYAAGVADYRPAQLREQDLPGPTIGTGGMVVGQSAGVFIIFGAYEVVPKSAKLACLLHSDNWNISEYT